MSRAVDPDVVDALKAEGIAIQEDGTAWLAHATAMEAARSIVESRQLRADAHGLIYVSTNRTILDDLSTQQQADTVIEVRLHVADLNISRAWDDRRRTDFVMSRQPRALYDVVDARAAAPRFHARTRKVLEWSLAIAGAVVILLALDLWVITPFRISSESMEPYLHCVKPGLGCRGSSADRVLACRICLDFSSPSRGDVVVFKAPPKAASHCAEGGELVKRVIGLPGETVREDKHGAIWVRGPTSAKPIKLKEPYIHYAERVSDRSHYGHTWHVSKEGYFVMGDNRGESCDSRSWGSVPRNDIDGVVFFVYWPLNRVGFR